MARALAREVQVEGIGLHTGVHSRVRIRPTTRIGIHFFREDLGSNAIAASVRRARPLPRRSAISDGTHHIQSVEHVLAALHALGIWNAELWVNGLEIPILDGSAEPYLRALRGATVDADEPNHALVARRRFGLHCGDSAVSFFPAEELLVSVRADIRQRSFRFRRVVPSALGEFTWARTFAHLDEIQSLRRAGLAIGGSLENAVVLTKDGTLNEEGLRSEDEPARHKVLDVFGDLMLLGGPLRGHVVLTRPSHRLTVTALREALEAGAIVADP